MNNFNFTLEPKTKSHSSGEGHNWFFYWKYAPSLWQEKLKQYQGKEVVYVPVNWGWHQLSSEQFDFGQINADRDLKKIQHFALDLKIDIVFLIPVSPVPFMSHGGAPKYLSVYQSQNDHQMNDISLGENKEQYGQTSFFHPEVFADYFQFIERLKVIVQRSRLRVRLVEFFAFSKGDFVNLFQDYSVHFAQGFDRFVKKQKDLDRYDQAHWEAYYRQEIRGLYLEAAKDVFSLDSEVDKIAVLGAGVEQVLRRTFSTSEINSDLFKQTFRANQKGLSPVSFMLSLEERAVGIDQFLKQVYGNQAQSSALEGDQGFKPYKIFHLYGFSSLCWHHWKQVGLFDQLDHDYPWLVMHKEQDDLNIDELDNNVVYFFGGDFSETVFHKIINLFYSGAKIFIDTLLTSTEIKKKLETFILENNLTVESVKLIASLKKASLGEGSFYLYSSGELIDKEVKDQAHFWQKIFKTLKIEHLTTLESDQNIFSFWEKRDGSPYELNYQEVRRLHLFNPDQKRKEVKIGHHRHFAFLKSFEKKGVKISSGKKGLEIQMEPQSYIGLDYGYFSGDEL